MRLLMKKPFYTFVKNSINYNTDKFQSLLLRVSRGDTIGTNKKSKKNGKSFLKLYFECYTYLISTILSSNLIKIDMLIY